MADYYLDFNHGSTITGTVTFTESSETISGSGTLFSTELSVGDYVKASAGAQWYKVTAITDDVTATISPAFEQATITDTAGATLVNSGDGSTSNPFCHLSQYTSDTIRSPGDRLLVQSGQTHVYGGGGDIVFDEDGTPENYIEILSSDWRSAGSTSNPIIDFGGTNDGIKTSYDLFWKLSGIDLTNCTYMAFETGPSDGLVLDNVNFYGNNRGFYGTNFYGTGSVTIKNSSYHNNSHQNIYFQRGFVEIDSCDIDGGKITGESTDYGLQVTNGCIAIVKNTAFGQTIPHGLWDIHCNRGANVTLVNCLFDEAKVYIGSIGDSVKSYDHQQVKGAFWSKFFNGTIEKDTVEVRAGGAASSIKATPNSNCTENFPLEIAVWNEFDVQASAQTRTVYVKSIGISTTFPTAAQFYIEAEYYDTATGTTTSIARSTQVLTADNTWTALSVSFTPGQTGRVVYRIKVAYLEGAESYFVDNQLN